MTTLTRKTDQEKTVDEIKTDIGPATASSEGLVSTDVQTFAGDKTFNDKVGIGTAIPNAELHIKADSGSSNFLILEDTAPAPTNYLAKLQRPNNLGSPTGDNAALILKDHSSNNALAVQNESGTTKMTVKGDGTTEFIGTIRPSGGIVPDSNGRVRIIKDGQLVGGTFVYRQTGVGTASSTFSVPTQFSGIVTIHLGGNNGLIANVISDGNGSLSFISYSARTAALASATIVNTSVGVWQIQGITAGTRVLHVM